MVSALSLEVQAHFPLGKRALSDDANNFQDAYMEIYSMNIFHSNSYTAMLRVTFKNEVNVSFSNKIKDFFESYLHISLERKKEFKNKDMYTVCYYAHMSKNELMNITIDFYNRTKQFSYSQIFTLDYLEALYNKYGSEGNFGYLHYYSLDKTGQLEGIIDFSYSTFDNYSDGLHTYDLLKFLNLTSLPPGEVIIEGNAMQTYTHTDFYFKSLKTNVPYAVENTTYYNITKAFEVHMDARENITQLIISFETKENYNWDDFMTDYGGYILCGIVLLIPVAIIVVIVLHKQKKEALTEKKN